MLFDSVAMNNRIECMLRVRYWIVSCRRFTRRRLDVVKRVQSNRMDDQLNWSSLLFQSFLFNFSLSPESLNVETTFTFLMSQAMMTILTHRVPGVLDGPSLFTSKPLSWIVRIRSPNTSKPFQTDRKITTTIISWNIFCSVPDANPVFFY